MSGSSASTSAQVPQSPIASRTRRLPIGAEPIDAAQVHVRVWAPAARAVSVVVGNTVYELTGEPAGYFSGQMNGGAGTRYRFQIDGGTDTYPDPASRYQPEGPHGPSEVVDPNAFTWTDSSWSGVTMAGQVVYEMHVGTFTPAGTWSAAAEQLQELARLGITTIELMPIADFNGRFGWGYDGVNLFAPTRLYGRPDDLRAFVDRAHALRIAVILDVVYNHFGPVGNYLRAFAPAYFSDAYTNEWGDALNFDGPDAGPVREFFLANAGYWIDEFHLDGLRLDATQQIFDASEDHILAAVGRRAREAAGGRPVILIAENERQDARLVHPAENGGFGLDALWNDDFHHTAMVALTGRAEAYYSETHGSPQEFVSAAKYGFLFQGQYYHWQRRPRGTPSWSLPPAAFVSYLQNHDQVANSARGLRGHQLTSPGRWRAMTALCLLAPSTPMLFQGQEFSSSAPFLYFADFDADLAAAVRRGRANFLLQFPSMVDFERRGTLDDPGNPETFRRCVLDFREREAHRDAYALHRDLLALRRDDEAFRAQRSGGVDGAVLSDQAFLLRFMTGDHLEDRVLIVNLGGDLIRHSFPEPLLAPPAPALDWTVRWSSEAPAYGGFGIPPLSGAERWTIPGESATVLRAVPSEADRRRHALERRTR